MPGRFGSASVYSERVPSLQPDRHSTGGSVVCHSFDRLLKDRGTQLRTHDPLQMTRQRGLQIHSRDCRCEQSLLLLCFAVLQT
jgi:hypothetical protein